MNNIKMKRMRAGMTQLDLAKATNVSEAKICRVETGRCIAPPFLRQKIAGVLRTDAGELFGADGTVVEERIIIGDLNQQILTR